MSEESRSKFAALPTGAAFADHLQHASDAQTSSTARGSRLLPRVHEGPCWQSSNRHDR
jgi:hypothetical protein